MLRRAAAAALALLAGAMPALAEGSATMGGQVTVEGVLTDEGVTCPALRGDDGELYTLAGDIGDLGPGQRVRVSGQVPEASICMQGTTIEIEDISILTD